MDDEASVYANSIDVAACAARRAESRRLSVLFKSVCGQDPFTKDELTTFGATDWPRDASGDHVCPRCVGEGRTTFPVFKGESEARWVFCGSCGGTGKLAMMLAFELVHSERGEKELNDKITYYRDFIKRISTCKTCGGNEMKTMGLSTCKECGLEGRCPWGG